MKIGIVCYPTYGGSGVLATELGKALAGRGHQVHFISYQQPARLEHFHERIFYHEVAFADYPLFDFPPYETALASKLVDVVKYHQLDVLHVHYAIPHASVAYLAKQILASEGVHIPTVTTLHGTDITLVGTNAAYAPVVTFAINQSDAVTAVSESLRADTLNFFRISRPITVIPNFVDFERFKKTNKDHFKKAVAPFGEKIIIHVSNFRKVKRIEDVIGMFDLVRQQIPARLLLVGDGPERQKIEMLTRDLGVCTLVRFLGKQDAIEELLAIADIFVLPSEKESFGLSALEAMACEVPVISSNAGGLPEVNINGLTGFTADIGDVQTMANRALELLQNPELHAQFRKNALAQAQNFTLPEIVKLYEQVYEQVVVPAKTL